MYPKYYKHGEFGVCSVHSGGEPAFTPGDDSGTWSFGEETPLVPEPSIILLLGFGLIGLTYKNKKKE